MSRKSDQASAGDQVEHPVGAALAHLETPQIYSLETQTKVNCYTYVSVIVQWLCSATQVAEPALEHSSTKPQRVTSGTKAATSSLQHCLLDTKF